MPLEFVRNDITKMAVDAIVNAANDRLVSGGGVCGAIHRAAGPELQAECLRLGGCKTGEAKITGAYGLPCKFVIHAVGPVWRGGTHGERERLISCYRQALLLAKAHGCASIAFPLISSGIYGYPKDQALRIATDTIRDFLIENDDADMLVSIVIFDKDSFQLSRKLYAGIAEYIDDHYVDAHNDRRSRRRMEMVSRAFGEAARVDHAPSAASSLEDALGAIDESFSQMVLRKIDEKGMTDPECYKRANLDRKLFSRLRKDANYRPKKNTALAFAIALELPLPETHELLMKAGYALSHSDRGDIIVEYFIHSGQYDIFAINEALYSFDQALLGGHA